MTRRHFNALARIVAETTDPAERARLADAIAALCRAENPRFDRGRFLTACGVGG